MENKVPSLNNFILTINTSAVVRHIQKALCVAIHLILNKNSYIERLFQFERIKPKNGKRNLKKKMCVPRRELYQMIRFSKDL